jgi:hypothetical protein
MPSAGFEPAIPASKRLQTYALDRTATVSGGGRLFSVFPGLFSHPVTCEPLMVGRYVMPSCFFIFFFALGFKTKRGHFSDYDVVATVVSRDAGP